MTDEKAVQSYERLTDDLARVLEEYEMSGGSQGNLAVLGAKVACASSIRAGISRTELIEVVGEMYDDLVPIIAQIDKELEDEHGNP